MLLISQEPKKKDPVIVVGKDVSEVDVDYFLIPVHIRDHEGPLLSSFPVENRLLPQGELYTSSHWISPLSPWTLARASQSLWLKTYLAGRQHTVYFGRRIYYQIGLSMENCILAYLIIQELESN